MAYTGVSPTLNTDEQMGAFSGYIRRPIPNASGMTAQIFGENGDDADTILALSLSKYQDVQVFVNIYIIKDANGRIMKQGNDYPVISSFVGFVRRSKPQKDGMVAQFFAPNGEYADAVADLSKSEYQDCLVFVDVRGHLAAKDGDKIKQENITVIDHSYSDKLTKQQRADFSKKEKQFRKMNEKIEMSDFLTKIEVLTSLGKGDDFKQWLEEKTTCSHIQDQPCMNSSHTIQVNGLLKPFNYLPVCGVHEHEMIDENHIEEHKFYYEMKHILLLKQWAWHNMKKRFSYDGKSEPDPERIMEWVSANNLPRLPQNYTSVL